MLASCLLALQITAPLYAQDDTATVEPAIITEVPTETPLPEQTEPPAPLQLVTVTPTVELPTITATAIAVISTVTPTPTPTALMPTATAVIVLPTVTPTPNAIVFPAGPVALGSTSGTEQLVASVVQQPSFTMTLNGRDQVVDATMSVTLSDTRTENNGWNLQIAAVEIIDPNTGRTLPDTELIITDVAVECMQQPCILPVSTVQEGTIQIDPFDMEAVKFLNAAPGTGSGEMMVKPTLQLHIPAHVYAGDYQMTVAVIVVSGP